MKMLWDRYDNLLIKFEDTENGDVVRKIPAEDVAEIYAEIRRHFKLGLYNDETLERIIK